MDLYRLHETFFFSMPHTLPQINEVCLMFEMTSHDTYSICISSEWETVHSGRIMLALIKNDHKYQFPGYHLGLHHQHSGQ